MTIRNLPSIWNDDAGSDDQTNTSVMETTHIANSQTVMRRRITCDWTPGKERVDYKVVVKTPEEVKVHQGSFYMQPPPGPDNRDEPVTRFLEMLDKMSQEKVENGL